MHCQMKLFPIAFCLIALATVASAQKLIKGSEPTQTDLPGYLDAYCSSVPKSFRICRVRTTEDGDAQFLFLEGETTIRHTEAPFWSTAGTDPENFFSYRGDLDNDGSKEIVLVSQDGVGNGMGISYSTVHIFNGRTMGHQEPITFSIEEFGDRQNFIYNPRTRQTEILISYWDSYESIDRKRGWGMYLIGKWFQYRNGKLERIPQRPTLARRFLDSFARQRNNIDFEDRRPYLWLSDRRAHRIFREPDEMTKPIRVRYGTIEQETPGNPEVGIRLVIVSRDGQAITGMINAPYDMEKNEVKINITAVGDFRSRYLYPITRSGIQKLSVFTDPVIGQKVRLETYKREFGGEFTKMWFIDR